jgi:tRNA-dihydrouridine synthase C
LNEPFVFFGFALSTGLADAPPYFSRLAEIQPMQIALAPMEGLVDDILRDVLTRVSGIDWCVTEFIRVTERLLPPSYFHGFAPELRQGSRTAAGVPLRVQLLGSDPACLADNAALACTLGAPVIDLNFGCPAKTVNKSRGGAVLLKEPELLNRILEEVRRAVPADIPVTAKMRLGFDSPDVALDCARALADGGAGQIVVHARTKVEGYKPPAHWEWVGRVQEVVRVPVYANGEIWTVEDWRRCREISGAQDIMLGRGLVSCPDLARQIVAAQAGHAIEAMTWTQLLPLIEDFWRQAEAKLTPRAAPGRLKQWVAMLTRTYPEAVQLFALLKREHDPRRVSELLGLVPAAA